MKLWLVCPLFALVQATCYDYEYYDPTTGASQGNACAAQQAKAAAAAAGGTSVGQPTTTFGQPATTTTFGQPLAQQLPSTTFGTSFTAPYTPVASTTVSGFPSAPLTSFATAAPAYSTTSIAAPYGVASTVAAPYTVASTLAAPYTVASTLAAPYAVASTLAAPYAVASTLAAPYAVAAPAGVVSTGVSGATSTQSAEAQRLIATAQRQNQQHQINSRIVKRATKDNSKASLINTLVAGSGHALPFYPAYRLNNQKKVVDAYRSEKQIANRNADDAYQRYIQSPSQLNGLISKYSDLNADLKGATYQYNVVDQGTFGQNLAVTGILGLSGGGVYSGLNQIITSRKQSDDLQNIQRKMQRVARQITTTVKSASQQAQAGVAVAQPVIQPGSVQQRMMAMSTYGPQVVGG